MVIEKENKVMFDNFEVKRGRTWEAFIDESYYHMTCVRVKGEKDFNSELSFHFPTSAQAKEFIELIKISS